MIKALPISFVYLLIGLQFFIANADATRVLYFTHEPGKWHKYTPQLEHFKKIADKAKWEYSVMTGSHDSQINQLRAKDFGKGFDAIVYNFCFAKSEDHEACQNLQDQTTIHGVPALLIHCSMHSFWGTYKAPRAKKGKEIDMSLYTNVGKNKEAIALKSHVDAWEKQHPNKPFPVWGDFTGVASTSHGPKEPIKVEKVTQHPATANYPDNHTTMASELYNNYYITEDVTPLLKGTQEKTSDEAIIMWEAQRGKGKVMGLTLGHYPEEWETEAFQSLIINGVNSLVK